MKKFLLAVAVGVFSISSSMAMAKDTNGYVGINYGKLEQKSHHLSSSNPKIKTDKVIVRLIGDINDYFSSELRYGATTKKGKTETDIAVQGLNSKGDTVRFSQTYLATALFRAGLPIGPIKPYLAVGYTFGQEKLSSTGGTAKKRFDDVSYGGGIDITIEDTVVINAEWLQYDDRSGLRMHGPSFGLGIRY